MNEKGEKDIEVLTTSQALQIAGRAGRYGTQYEEGEVTTFRGEDLNTLKDVMLKPVDPIEVSNNELWPSHTVTRTYLTSVGIFASILWFWFFVDSQNFTPLRLVTVRK